MKFEDLIQLGKIQVFGDKLFVRFLPNYDKEDIVFSLKDVFLIFTGHSVRYGKIKVENKKQKKYQISISDKNLYEEVINSQNVVLAIENRELEKIEDLLGYFDPVGMKVIWNDIEVATIKGYFSNGAHDVYELQLENGKEILIPDVEAFVIETNIKKRYIKVVDLDQFIYD